MKESFNTMVSGVETPMSAFEKNKAAVEAIEDKVEALVAEQGINDAQFTCPSGEVAQCATEHDREIADRQARAKAVAEVLQEVEGVDPYQERAAKKYQELLEREADVLIRQAEWASYKGEAPAANNQPDAPQAEADASYRDAG